jgi:hypothetical protein
MTERHADFLLYSGSSWQFDASLHDAACAPLDLTGAQIAWRLYSAGGAQVLELTRDNGISVINEVGGLCRITVTAEQSAGIGVGSYRDEIVVSMPAGFVSTQAIGTIVVNKPGGYVPPLQAALASLKAARFQGLRSVRVEGFETVYASDQEMAAAISALESEIAGIKTPRNVIVRSSKGW